MSSQKGSRSDILLALGLFRYCETFVDEVLVEK